jgi:hypothetical protein
VTESPATRYLRLGLRLGRHVDGMVDAYFGPRELADAVDAEPLVEPRTLVADADALLDELDDGWLRDQVVGLHTFAGVLAGESLSYPDEVERCYGVRPTFTDEAVFAAAHERLEELLPGEGTLAERHEAWETSIRIPTEHVERVVAAAIEEARARTRDYVELPEGETVELEIVHDEPWLAFCAYEGELRSRIQVNVDLPISAIEALVLTIHETYPGHHAERCAKEQLLVRGRGLLEETIVMVPTPQSVVSEGIASLAPDLLLDGEGAHALAEVTREAGVELDVEHAQSVRRAKEPCGWASVNAALMLYEDGAADDEVVAYARRWGLATAEVANHLLRFLKEPTSRTYVITYDAGLELCRAWVGNDRARFRTLLTEQVRVSDLLAAGV